MEVVTGTAGRIEEGGSVADGITSGWGRSLNSVCNSGSQAVQIVCVWVGNVVVITEGIKEVVSVGVDGQVEFDLAAVLTQ